MADERLVELRAAGSNRLIEQRQSVAQAALGRLGQHAERAFACFEPFRARDLPELRHELLVIEQAECEMLAARLNRGRELVGLGGGENK